MSDILFTNEYKLMHVGKANDLTIREEVKQRRNSMEHIRYKKISIVTR